MRKIPVPEIGKEYHFFDDGKISNSRHSIAKVTDIITPDQAKEIFFEVEDYDTEENVKKSLYDIWKTELNEHRNTETFHCYGHGSTGEAGTSWLYAEETDFFVKCSIPEYDENDIWFARILNNEWFSFDTVNFWMSGLLDVTGEYYKILNEQ